MTNNSEALSKNHAAVPVGTMAKDGFGETSLARIAETASSAVAAQATAEIQAMYIMAMKNPRDWMNVRDAMLAHCRRPRFAEKARYAKPVGGRSIEGPSIRFAEALMQSMGNVRPTTMVTFDDDAKCILRIAVTDLEKNVSPSSEVVIDKTVERLNLKAGQEPISVRVNSVGKRTYLVQATEDDLRNKKNAIVSKELRTHILRIVPSDIIEECMDLVVETQQAEDAKDPQQATKRLADAFSAIGVKPSDLKEYLGHGIDTLSPPETVHLRALYAAIRDGETSWKDALALKTAASDPEASDGAPPTALKERLKAQAEKTKKVDVAKGPKPAETTSHDPATGEVVEPREPGSDDR